MLQNGDISETLYIRKMLEILKNCKKHREHNMGTSVTGSQRHNSKNCVN